MPKRDVYQEVTDTIIQHLEAGTAPWRKEWQGGATLSMPRRSCGQHYQGINVLLLWIAAQNKGYQADQWMTYKQARDMGAQVRKGEKGTGIVFFSTFKKEDKQTGEEITVPVAKSYTVFNVQQIDDLPASHTPITPETIDTGARPIGELEAFYCSTGARIINDGSQPRYNPTGDVVYMPQHQQFETAQAYYGTLAHELIHWTGHKSRLDRLQKQKREHYAFEELIAELGACMVTTQYGGIADTENSAAYLQSWLKALRNDKRMIFRAASAAQKATQFLIDASEMGRTLIAAE